MKRLFYSFILIAVMITVFVVPAYAGVMDTIKGFFTLDRVLSGALFLFALVAGPLLLKFKTTLKESGNFIDAISDAVDDNKVTKDEVKAIIAKKDDVISIWKKTPEQFQVK